MAIIGQLTGATGLLNGATGLVNSVRKPSLKSADFASVLKERMRLSNDPVVMHQRAEKARTDADSTARRFMQLRDYNNDQLLSRDESGLEAAAFGKLDTNSDGRLTLDELKKPSTDAIARMYSEGAPHV